jgi:hypothetical protein
MRSDTCCNVDCVKLDTWAVAILSFATDHLMLLAVAKSSRATMTAFANNEICGFDISLQLSQPLQLEDLRDRLLSEII